MWKQTVCFMYSNVLLQPVTDIHQSQATEGRTQAGARSASKRAMGWWSVHKASNTSACPVLKSETKHKNHKTKSVGRGCFFQPNQILDAVCTEQMFILDILYVWFFAIEFSQQLGAPWCAQLSTGHLLR